MANINKLWLIFLTFKLSMVLTAACESEIHQLLKGKRVILHFYIQAKPVQLSTAITRVGLCVCNFRHCAITVITLIVQGEKT